MPQPLSRRGTLTGILVVAIAHAPLAHAALRTINVSNNSQLSAALGAALPGDEIVLANGNYAGFTIGRSGTGPEPNRLIKIRAQNQGGAVINSGVIHFNNTAHVTIEGLTITSPGAVRSFDNVSWNVAVLFQSADYSRLTRSTLQLTGQPSDTYWVMLAGDSNHNRIDHNEIGPDPGRGIYIYTRGNPNIPGVTFTPSVDRGPWAHGLGPYNPNMARNTRIDHNYIHGHTDRESLILGGIGMTGDYQDTATVVEYNLFENNRGDSELISIKTSGSTIRYNTVRNGYGAIVNRAGNNSRIYGNTMLQGGAVGSLGIRLHEMNHEVYNNYIENTDGFGIQVYEGDLYDESNGITFTHAQVVNAKIMHNTIVNPGGPAIQIGAGGNVLPPKDVIIANNIFARTTGSGTLFTEDTSNPGINMTYSQNIIWPQNPNKAGFLVVNPQLTTVGELRKLSASSPAINAANQSYSLTVTEDMDGQLRDVLRDIGADEFSSGIVRLRPLTTADVGPLAASLDADLNQDGVLNPADWALFKSGQGLSFAGMTPVQSYFLGDLNGDLRHDLVDFALFRLSYDETNGTGTFAQMLAAVPEPTTLMMVFATSLIIATRRRARFHGRGLGPSAFPPRYHRTVSTIAVLLGVALAAPGRAAQSQWVYFDNTGHLAYQTWGNGNRIMDFSHAGYMGGGVAIPNAPAKITLSPLAGGADNTAAIQNAINSVAAMPLVNGIRGAVVLNAGTYNIANTINLNASGVVLRGAGIGQTIINQLRPDGSSGFLAFDVGGSGSRSTSGQPTANLTAAYVPSGATSFTVSSTAGFNVGDQVVVNRTVTAEWISYLGMDQLVRDGAPQTWISAGTKIPTDRVIKAISGNTIALDAPLTDSFDATYLGSPVGTLSKYTFSGRVSQVGLENLTIQNSVPNATGNSINMDDVLDSWVRNVESKENRDAYSIGNDAKRVTWDRVKSSNAVPNTNSAAPADFAVTGTQILLNQCEQNSEGQWAYVTQARGTGPIVILNSTSSDRGVSPHQRWTTGVLTDGGFMEGTTGIEYSNRTTAGSGHGWTTGWSVAWNVATPRMKVEAAPGTMNWCIGCTGTQVSTSQPPGIYESLGTKVDLGETDSLYLEQLRERLGDKALINIGYLPSADINSDGFVNTADWTRFKSGQSMNLTGMTSAQAYSWGDLNGDFRRDLYDFAAFRRAYIAFNGASAFAQLAGVPEPTSHVMALFALLPLFARHRVPRKGRAAVVRGEKRELRERASPEW